MVPALLVVVCDMEVFDTFTKRKLCVTVRSCSRVTESPSPRRRVLCNIYIRWGKNIRALYMGTFRKKRKWPHITKAASFMSLLVCSHATCASWRARDSWNLWPTICKTRERATSSYLFQFSVGCNCPNYTIRRPFDKDSHGNGSPRNPERYNCYLSREWLGYSHENCPFHRISMEARSTAGALLKRTSVCPMRKHDVRWVIGWCRKCCYAVLLCYKSWVQRSPHV